MLVSEGFLQRFRLREGDRSPLHLVELMNNLDETRDTLGDGQSSTKVADLKEGTRIHRYQILGLIGKGGMGAVYKAYDPELDRSIAIKILTAVPCQGETASRPRRD